MLNCLSSSLLGILNMIYKLYGKIQWISNIIYNIDIDNIISINNNITIKLYFLLMKFNTYQICQVILK